jgi:hypothetical protein
LTTTAEGLVARGCVSAAWATAAALAAAWSRRRIASVRALEVAVVAAGSALAVTWPLVLHLTDEVPIGTENERTIPFFSLWNVWWSENRLTHAFHGFLDAPFFFPTHGVTTYSEPMPFLGLLSTPLWLLGLRPTIVYNLLVLLVVALNGVFAFRGARALGASTGAAYATLALGVSLPFATHYLGVLPTIAVFPMLWALEGLIRFARSGSTGAAAWAWAGYAALYYTFQQYALFFAPFFAAAIVIALLANRDRARAANSLALPTLAGVAAVLLLAIPTARVHSQLDLTRDPIVVRALSARASDLLTQPTNTRLAILPRRASDTGGLFPGLGLTLLTLGALAALARRGGRRRWPLYFAASAGGALLLSLGLNLALGPWRPFGTLRDHVGLLAEVRSPFRAAALMQVFMLLLVASWLASLSRRRAALAAAVTIAVLGSAVSVSLAQPLRTGPQTDTAWIRWLARAPAGTVVAHVPFPPRTWVSDYEIEAARLDAQIEHGKPLINGYSGYFPEAVAPNGTRVPAYIDFQLAMARAFPTKGLLCTLGGLGANTLVFDRSWAARHRAALRRFARFLIPRYRDSQVEIARLELPPDACR